MLIASTIMVLSGLIKKKDKIIIWQTIQIGMQAIGNLILGSWAGVIDNGVGCFRNILYHKQKLNIWMKFVVIAIYTTLSFLFNNMGWIGIVMWIGSIAYIMLMDLKNVVQFKLLIITTMIIWTIHDLMAQSYVALAFDIGTIIANTIAIIRILLQNQKGALCVQENQTKESKN